MNVRREKKQSELKYACPFQFHMSALALADALRHGRRSRSHQLDPTSISYVQNGLIAARCGFVSFAKSVGAAIALNFTKTFISDEERKKANH